MALVSSEVANKINKSKAAVLEGRRKKETAPSFLRFAAI